MDLAAERFAGQVVADEDGAHDRAEFLDGLLGGVLGAAAGEAADYPADAEHVYQCVGNDRPAATLMILTPSNTRTPVLSAGPTTFLRRRFTARVSRCCPV